MLVLTTDYKIQTIVFNKTGTITQGKPLATDIVYKKKTLNRTSKNLKYIILGGIKMKKKILIEGMSCGHCVNHVKEALSELNGITNVEVNLDTKYATLDASNNVKDEDIKYAINDAGYEVVGIEVM